MYKGMWSHSKAYGKGKLVEPAAKTKYVGDFVRDQKEGFGK